MKSTLHSVSAKFLLLALAYFFFLPAANAQKELRSGWKMDMALSANKQVIIPSLSGFYSYVFRYRQNIALSSGLRLSHFMNSVGYLPAANLFLQTDWGLHKKFGVGANVDLAGVVYNPFDLFHSKVSFNYRRIGKDQGALSSEYYLYFPFKESGTTLRAGMSWYSLGRKDSEGNREVDHYLGAFLAIRFAM